MKHPIEHPDGSAASPGASAGDASVEADLMELVRLMPPVLRGLKRQETVRESASAGSVRGLLAEGALGPRHLPVIVVLTVSDSITVSELAHRIGLGVAATSLMLGELDRAGIVEREIDPRDRRRTLVRIGAPLRDECVAFVHQRLAPMRRALQLMGPETRAHFIAGWRVLAEQTSGAAAFPSEVEDVEPATEGQRRAATS